MKSFKELCVMTKIPEVELRKILEKAMKTGTIKEVLPDMFEITESGEFIIKKIITNGMSRDAGTWKCTKCDVINNILNGNNCLKCNYSFKDNLASEELKKRKRKLLYPQVTDRETLIFLLGQSTGLAMNFSHLPKKSIMGDEMSFDKTITDVFLPLTVELAHQFPTVSQDEISEIMIQLDATKTLPIINNAIKKLKEIFEKY